LPGEEDGRLLAVLVAILGTTISPYLFFGQTGQEVEAQAAAIGLVVTSISVGKPSAATMRSPGFASRTAVTR
jgi:Mn2+/Fe2+ NRAMP family transporter